MPESESVKATTFLVIALSGRALATSAGRAGHKVIVLDLFNDLDTRTAAWASAKVPGCLGTGFNGEALIGIADYIVPPDVGLVYGSGFENRPALLAALAARRRLYGNTPETLARIKNPKWFFGTLNRLCIPHPETRLDIPADRRGWLVKKAGAAGGAHIRNAEHAETEPRSYFQRRIPGRSVSALFVADGRMARVLGFSEQWASVPTEDRPFRYAGAAFPATVAPDLGRAVTRAVRSLTAEAGLVGVNSIDMLIDDAGFHVLEVNPRPGATVEIFDRGLNSSLFDLHVRACDGDLLAVEMQPVVTFASEIVYATHSLVIPSSQSWPGWAADLPAAGTRIGVGEPVCTVSATGSGLEETKDLVRHRADEILAAITRSLRDVHVG